MEKCWNNYLRHRNREWRPDPFLARRRECADSLRAHSEYFHLQQEKIDLIRILLEWRKRDDGIYWLADCPRIWNRKRWMRSNRVMSRASYQNGWSLYDQDYRKQNQRISKINAAPGQHPTIWTHTLGHVVPAYLKSPSTPLHVESEWWNWLSMRVHRNTGKRVGHWLIRIGSLQATCDRESKVGREIPSICNSNGVFLRSCALRVRIWRPIETSVVRTQNARVIDFQVVPSALHQIDITRWDCQKFGHYIVVKRQ